MSIIICKRPRRNRRTEAIRQLVRETDLRPENFVLPIFIIEGKSKKEAIVSMPDFYRLSLDEALIFGEHALSVGVKSVALFPVVEDSLKDPRASAALNPEGLVPRAIAEFKSKFPELTVISDVAMDPYSSDGHDGLVESGKIVNDETLEILAAMALVQANAGADFVAPSDMMDGRVLAIRSALDGGGFSETGIISYSAKYCSSFYSPFREALDSAPRGGDKKTYQMDFANSREALREVKLDIEEGADIVMIKPALAYLDVIAAVKRISAVPVAAYNVSGEYSMIKASAKAGFLDENSSMLETLTAIKRAGADIIFTYFALSAARLIQDRV